MSESVLDRAQDPARDKIIRRAMACCLAGILIATGMIFAPDLASSAQNNEGINFGIQEKDENDPDAPIPPDFPEYKYAAIWATPTNSGVKWQLDRAENRDHVPVVHFYYWGDDISPTCVENGCESEVNFEDGEPIWKDFNRWLDLRDDVIGLIKDEMGGKRTIVTIELEFNKNEIDSEDYASTFNDYLINDIIEPFEAVTGVETLVGFGEWSPAKWDRFTGAVQASSILGSQLLWTSVNHEVEDAADRTEGVLSDLIGTFGPGTEANMPKETYIFDWAVSTWEEDDNWHYEEVQADQIEQLRINSPTLRDDYGLEGFVFRTLNDDGDTSQNWGEAECCFGFADASMEEFKTGYFEVVDWMNQEEQIDDDFSVTFHSERGNEWWVEVEVDVDSGTLAGVDARVDSGGWQELEETDWESWAKSITAPAGSVVEFRAHSTLGESQMSDPYPWPPSDLNVAFYNVCCNEGWVETSVQVDDDIVAVEARVDGGTWEGLEETGWGDWATGDLPAPDGSIVEFRAHNADGDTDISQEYAWEPFKVWWHGEEGNEWWIETDATIENGEVDTMETQVDGGDWTEMDETDWDTWAVSIHAPEGSMVKFRATSTNEENWISDPIPWPPSDLDVLFYNVCCNEGWVETAVETDDDIVSVEARVDGGSWEAMEETGSGDWATGELSLPDGSTVELRAQNAEGDTDISQEYPWQPFKVWWHSEEGNEWWIETDATIENGAVETMETRVDEGDWIEMDVTDWDTWAVSTHAPEGSLVDFRATSTNEEIWISDPIEWPPE